MLANNHYCALLRWRDIGEEPPEAEPLKVKELISECTPIVKKQRRLIKPFNTKIAAYDLECTGNGTYDNVHECYAVGIAWCDEQGNHQYESFWNDETEGTAIHQFLNFIVDMKEEFAGYTFYAHNGGKYDMPFLLRGGLLDDDRFILTPKRSQPIEQNGCYLKVKAQIEDDNKHIISFHDSIRLLDGPLEKLCKEFKVEHQKLTETVSHDDITIDNWHDYLEKLELYLEHDCRGLLEVLLEFNKSVFEETKQFDEYVNEAYCKQLLEAAWNCKLDKKRPSYVKGFT